LRFGSIAITTNVDGAKVMINGKEGGVTPLAGHLKVPAPASYDVSLAKKGYLPFSARINVPPDATVEVRAELTPRRRLPGTSDGTCGPS